MARPWSVVLKPEPGNEGTNTGGLTVLLTDGVDTVEVTRVAFVRRNAANPDVSFVDQLSLEIDKATEAALMVNDLNEAEEARAENMEAAARAKIHDLIGRPSAVPA